MGSLWVSQLIDRSFLFNPNEPPGRSLILPQGYAVRNLDAHGGGWVTSRPQIPANRDKS
jgi:hypothetical protein